MSNAVPRRGQENSPGYLASIFECPVCFGHALPPIHQCQAGHLVCSLCLPRLNHCPTCRGPLLGNIRNLALEKVAKIVSFPCKYSSNGCDKQLPYTEKTKHEDNCDWRPYDCPYPGPSCEWQGSLKQVVPHLKRNHRITTLNGYDILFLANEFNVNGAVDWIMIQSCFGHHFLLLLEKQDNQDGQTFLGVVRMIGNEKEAAKYRYRMEITGSGRRLFWEAPTRSIQAGMSYEVLNSDCLKFSPAVAQLCSEDENLGICVKIFLEDRVVTADD